MSNPKKFDFRQVLLMTIICAIAIAVPHVAWSTQTAVNFHNTLFAVVDLFLIAMFVIMCIVNFRNAKSNETETNGKHAFTISLAAAVFVWVAGWAAYINELVK